MRPVIMFICVFVAIVGGLFATPIHASILSGPRMDWVASISTPSTLKVVRTDALGYIYAAGTWVRIGH